jgi:hypothetical protein
MTAPELCYHIRTWCDALTLAKAAENPFFFSVDSDIDLHGWHVESAPEGLRFWRISEDDQGMTSITVLSPEGADPAAPPPAIWTDTRALDVVCWL